MPYPLEIGDRVFFFVKMWINRFSLKSFCNIMKEMVLQRRREMTREEFFEFIHNLAIVRKDSESPKVVEMSDEDKELVYSIQNKDVTDSCEILSELYKKYKANQEYPTAFLEAVYYVVYKYLTDLWKNEVKAFNNGEDKNLILLDKDGAIRKKKRDGITTEVFEKITGGSSSQQEKWGMYPADDFMMRFFDPINMYSSAVRGTLFNSIISAILQYSSCGLFIDLTGDCTIFEDISPRTKEIMVVSDSLVGDLYYIIKHELKEFIEVLKMALKDRNVTDRDYKEYSGAEVYELLPENIKQNLEYADEGKKYLISYPYCKEEERVYRVVDDFLKAYPKCKAEDVSDIERTYGLLRDRLSATSIVCASISDVLESIERGAIPFLDLEEQAHKSNVEFKEKTINNGNFSTQKSKDRKKPGILFYDFNVNRSLKDAIILAEFVNTHEGKWVVVCDKDNIVVREIFKGKGRKSVEINTESDVAFTYLSPELSANKILITNIFIEDVYSIAVDTSPIFNVLKIMDACAWESYEKILVKNTIDEPKGFDFADEEDIYDGE